MTENTTELNMAILESLPTAKEVEEAPVIDFTKGLQDSVTSEVVEDVQDTQLAETVGKQIPFEFISAILIKPLNTVMVEREAEKPIVDPSIHDKYYGANSKSKPADNKPATYMAPATAQAGVIIKTPKHLPDHLSDLKCGDVIVCAISHFNPFELIDGTALVSPASVLGFYLGGATKFNQTVGASKVNPTSSKGKRKSNGKGIH